MTLHVWKFEEETVIAESLEDALDVAREYHCLNEDDEVDAPRKCPPDELLGIWWAGHGDWYAEYGEACNGNGENRYGDLNHWGEEYLYVEAPCSVWCANVGVVGLLASTNY
jgi:hypothetical protein